MRKVVSVNAVEGVYEGADDRAILDAYARDAGYADYAALTAEHPGEPDLYEVVATIRADGALAGELLCLYLMPVGDGYGIRIIPEGGGASEATCSPQVVSRREALDVIHGLWGRGWCMAWEDHIDV